MPLDVFQAVHPVTGEVLDEATALEVASEVAALLVEEERLRREKAASLRVSEEACARLRSSIRSLVPVEGSVRVSPTVSVVVQPGKPGRRGVDAQACEAYRNELVALGLGRVEARFRPPKISEVDAARAELTAAGVPVSVIAPDPEKQPAEVVVVDQEVPF